MIDQRKLDEIRLKAAMEARRIEQAFYKVHLAKRQEVMNGNLYSKVGR